MVMSYTNPAMFYYRKIQSDKIDKILSEPKSGPYVIISSRINVALFHTSVRFTPWSIPLERINK